MLRSRNVWAVGKLPGAVSRAAALLTSATPPTDNTRSRRVNLRKSSVRWRGPYNPEVPDSEFVETDHRGRITLPGHPNSRFLLRHNADGSILLQPAQLVADAQYEYWSNPELRTLLAAAASSRTVHRKRDHRD
jgi:hypothetical protein